MNSKAISALQPTNQTGEAQERLTRLEKRRAALLLEISEARAWRSQHARECLLGDGTPSKGWANAAADEQQALALLTDVDALLPVLQGELSRAEAAVKSDAAKAASDAFAARLAVVVHEKGIVVPPGEEAKFAANAESAYRWLGTMYRTAEVNRTHYVVHWLDLMSAAGYGAVRRTELLAAAFTHGDIEVQNGGDNWNTFLGVHQYVGREALSVPLGA